MTYSLTHLRDEVLLHNLATLNTRDQKTTAALLAHIAEVERRRLYAPAGYSSMHAYCVRVLRLSEDVAYKRIRAARAARKFPAIFEAIADGRLHVGAVVVVAPHLTPANASELLATAEHKTKSDVERLVAERFPGQDVPARVRPVRAQTAVTAPPPDSSSSLLELAPGPVSFATIEHEPRLVEAPSPQPAPSTPSHSNTPTPAPISAPRFALQVTLDEGTHAKLRRAQTLLGHAVRTRDIAQMLDRALDALIATLEKRKFAVTLRPRATSASRPPAQSRSTQQSSQAPRPLSTSEPALAPTSSRSARYVSAQVRREIVKRDGGRCTFVSETGHRCDEVSLLEFDHIQAVAKGGGATADNLRLRCRAHNQYEAERSFGVEFMRRRREEARSAADPG